MIPTAEDFSDNYSFIPQFGDDHIDHYAIYKFAVEFAKLHVEAALKAASEKAIVKRITGYSGDESGGQSWQKISVEKASVLSAYPLENIK